MTAHDWEDLFAHAPCGYLVSTPDGRLLAVNETFLAWTGHDRAALLGGGRLPELLTPGDRIFHETHYTPLLRMQGFVREIAVTLVGPDGRRLPALLNAAVAGDTVRTAVFLAEDRRTYERELLEARRRAEASEASASTLAATLQQSLLPPDLPTIPGLDLAAVFRPAGRGDEIGGDFYDVFEVRPGDWTVMIGDVCGKGAPAAALTSLLRYSARAIAVRTRRPRTLLTRLNEAVFAERVRRPRCFATAACVRLQSTVDGVRVSMSLGGHPHPYLLTPDAAPTRIGRTGTMLGAVPEPLLHETSMRLAPGESIVLYTDGLTEARSGDAFFGEDGLESLLAELGREDASGIAHGIADAVLAYQQDYANDDIAVIVIRALEPH